MEQAAGTWWQVWAQPAAAQQVRTGLGEITAGAANTHQLHIRHLYGLVVRELLAAGHTKTATAEWFGISRPAVYTYAQQP